MSDAVLSPPKTRRDWRGEATPQAGSPDPYAPTEAQLSLREKAVRARAALRAGRKASGWDILTWLPLAAGIVLAINGPAVRVFLQTLGDWPMRFALPLEAMIYQATTGTGADLPQNMPQIALAFQFIAEGLVVRLSLKQGFSYLAAALQILMMHSLATFVIWLISIYGNH